MVSRIFQRSFCRNYEHEALSIYQSFIEFDVRETREEHWKHDKFACMRYIFDEFKCKWSKVETKSPFLAIDETLYPHREHIFQAI